MTADARTMSLSLTQFDAPPVAGPADEQLVQRLLDGDTSAGDSLVQRYQLPLLRYLQRLSGTSQLAEELFQATWMSVLEHLDKFVPSASSGGFKAWLFRIATNKANDAWRSRARERAAKEGLKLVSEDESPQADAGADALEQQVKLKWAIDQLPENQRTVLLLRYYSQMKFVDIARMLGCPLNTALGRMHKAMLRLKELMES